MGTRGRCPHWPSLVLESGLMLESGTAWARTLCCPVSPASPGGVHVPVRLDVSGLGCRLQPLLARQSNRSRWERIMEIIHVSSSAHLVHLSVGYLDTLVAQLVKNLPAMWEMWVRALGWEDLLDWIPLWYSCLENPHGLRSLVGYSPRGHEESDTTE